MKTKFCIILFMLFYLSFQNSSIINNEDNLMYLGNVERNAVYAHNDINKFDKINWKHKIEGRIHRNQLIKEGNRIYYGYGYYNFVCINALDGRLEWETNIDDLLTNPRANSDRIISNGYIYKDKIIFQSKLYFFALSKINGNLIWKIKKYNRIQNNFIMIKNQLIAVISDYKTEYISICSINIDIGNVIWEKKYLKNSIGELSTYVCFSNNLLYFATNKHVLYAFDILEKKIKWNKVFSEKKEQYNFLSYPKIYEEKLLIFKSESIGKIKLYLFNKTNGKIFKTINIGNMSLDSQFLIINDKVSFVSGYMGNQYLVEIDLINFKYEKVDISLSYGYHRFQMIGFKNTLIIRSFLFNKMFIYDLEKKIIKDEIRFNNNSLPIISNNNLCFIYEDKDESFIVSLKCK